MSKQQVNSKIRKNLNELKSVMDLLASNPSKEKSRYLVHLARIYMYETIKLINDDRLPKSVREKAINEITLHSASLSPIAIISQKNRLSLSK